MLPPSLKPCYLNHHTRDEVQEWCEEDESEGRPTRSVSDASHDEYTSFNAGTDAAWQLLAPNGWRVSGERKRVRCTRVLGGGTLTTI